MTSIELNNFITKEMLTKTPELLLSFALPGIPEIKTGDKIASLIVQKMQTLGGIKEKDIFVVASKIVSKAEGRIVDLRTIKPSDLAYKLSTQTNDRKSPELCDVVLSESTSHTVINEIIITKHKLGYQMTSAGVDRLSDNMVSLIPQNPDQSAEDIMNHIIAETNIDVSIVISDSEGRADRDGAGAISLGVAGIDPLRVNTFPGTEGKPKKTIETISNMLACSAALQMGQRDKNTPVVCIRGFKYDFNNTAKLMTAIHL